MKRRFLILLLMAVAVIGAKAQTKMILHQKSGGDIEIAFSDKPVATFEGEEMVIATTKTTYRFPISNLATTSYDENGTATAIIESVTQLSPDAGPSRIYGLDGRLVKAVPDGEPVTVGTLPQGIYIIKNNNSSYKINKNKSFPHLKGVVEIATKPLSPFIGNRHSFFEIIEKYLRINNRLSIICCIFVMTKKQDIKQKLNNLL